MSLLEVEDSHLEVHAGHSDGVMAYAIVMLLKIDLSKGRLSPLHGPGPATMEEDVTTAMLTLWVAHDANDSLRAQHAHDHTAPSGTVQREDGG